MVVVVIIVVVVVKVAAVIESLDSCPLASAVLENKDRHRACSEVKLVCSQFCETDSVKQ